jgi:hypothetical protein
MPKKGKAWPTPQRLPVKGSQHSLLSSRSVSLPQVKEDDDKALGREASIWDPGFHFDKIFASGSALSEATLSN